MSHTDHKYHFTYNDQIYTVIRNRDKFPYLWKIYKGERKAKSRFVTSYYVSEEMRNLTQVKTKFINEREVKI